MAQLRSAWLSARRVAPMTRRRACRCLRQFGSAWLSLAQHAWPARAAPRHWSSALARPGLAQFGSVWFSLAQRPLREPQDVQARLADPWWFGSAWLSLVQLGSACVACACPFFGSAATFPCAGLAQLGSVWLSLAQRPAHRTREEQTRFAVPAAAWFSLAQPGSACRPGQRAQRFGRASSHAQVWLNMVQLGSAWLSARRAGALGVQVRLGADAAAWLSLAQPGSAWISLSQLAQPARRL